LAQLAGVKEELHRVQTSATTRIDELTQQWNDANAELEATRVEFEQYKLNARQVLAAGAQSSTDTSSVRFAFLHHSSFVKREREGEKTH
jgi:hypothetical protein